jgi:hypothetical protein
MSVLKHIILAALVLIVVKAYSDDQQRNKKPIVMNGADYCSWSCY